LNRDINEGIPPMRPLWLVGSGVFVGSAFWLLTGVALSGDGAAVERAKPLPEVRLAWGVKIPLRDKVRLNATVYKPASEKAVPAIVTITPYTADNYHDRAMYFARNGYVFVMVDSRGRGNSEGHFEPFANEGKDGFDVVEWVAKQKWCNGNVGMWGGSYGGYNQWATLKENPPHLKTIVPVASAHPGVDFPAPQGIFNSYFMQWLTLTSGVTNNAKLWGDADYWIPRFRDRYLNHRPLKDLDVICGNANKYFHKWLEHRRPDAYWDAMVPAPEHYAKLDLPILTITGQYDADQLGAMEFYHRHMKYGSDEGKKKHYLIIGPWDHAGTRKPELRVGGVTFGLPSLLDMNELHKAWYDWTMDEGLKPEQLSTRIAYYVAGLERWRHINSLDYLNVKRRQLYLNSSGQANDVFRSGVLQPEEPEKSPPDRYTYDPLDTRPARLEKEKVENYLTDQRQVLNLFGNGLIYHSDPFTQPTEITGYVKFTAWIKLNVPDTDFLVQVYEVQPDGGSILLTEDRLRARHRESFRTEKLVKPGTINCYEFKSFSFLSRRLLPGSRLRLVFRCPNSIYLEKNYNSGGAVECETARDARTAEVTLYHDEDHPSCLEIPEIKGVKGT
jgi:putative CocE/NonD family hydrolase